jgi:hypothetical protein
MNHTVFARGARVLAWLLGAVASGVGWYAVSVYGLGNYDQAYGPLAIFQIGSALALLFAIMGLVGYAVTVAFDGSRQPVWIAIAAGALFAIVMQCIAFGLGHAMPNGVPWLLPIVVAVFLGAASTRLNRRNEA